MKSFLVSADISEMQANIALKCIFQSSDWQN